MPDVAEAIQAGKLLAKVQTPLAGDGTPFILSSDTDKVFDLESLLPAPTRKKGTVSLHDLTSFTRFVNEHKTDTTRIFVSVSDIGAEFHTVFDFHGKANPQWCDFRAAYTARATPEWLKWTQNNKKLFSQAEFALFLEDLQNHFRDPTGAMLMELVLTLEGHKNCFIQSGQRLQNGQHRITYREEIELKGTVVGSIDIPQVLTLGIPIFDRKQPWESKARLRYRIEASKIQFFYEIIDLHLIIQGAVDDMITIVGAQTKITPFLGGVPPKG